MTFKQGDIIKFNFDPTLGHEQGKYRPALVISRTLFNVNTGQAVVCPITNQTKSFPTRLKIDDEKMKTKGFIICDHIKTIDVEARSPRFVESVPNSLLIRTLEIIQTIICSVDTLDISD